MKAKKSIELKPCPFCGSEPQWATSQFPNDFGLQCQNESCRVYIICEAATEAETIANWNMRTAAMKSIPTAAMKTRLRAAMDAYRGIQERIPLRVDMDEFEDAMGELELQCEVEGLL